MKNIRIILILSIVFLMSACSNDDDVIKDTPFIKINGVTYPINNGYINEEPIFVAKGVDGNSRFHFFFTNGELINGNCNYSVTTDHVLSFRISDDTGEFSTVNTQHRTDFALNTNNGCNNFGDVETLNLDVKISKTNDFYNIEFSGTNISGKFQGTLTPTDRRSTDDIL